MKQVDTEPGSQYSVDSAAGCTVSTPAGQVICRVMPGILGSFMASGYVTCFSDDAAGVTLVASGTPGGTGGQQMQISQALDAANRAEAAREKAEAASGDAEEAAARVEELKRVTLDVAAGAALDAERAVAAKDEAVLAMGAAAADAQVAAGRAAEAEVSREAAEAAAAGAGARAAEAEASAKVAAEAVSDALGARDEAAAARGGAEDAQSSAEEQAAIATAAAEAAQAPESIAAQAARPATMVLVKDELLAMLGDASLFDIDTDGQKIIVHTDRLDDALLAAVEDMLGRFVPQFIEFELHNHHIEVSWRDINKYAECTNARQMYDLYPDEFGVEVNFGCWNCFPINLTSDGDFPYPLPKMENFQQNWGNGFFKMVYVKHFEIDLPSLKFGHMAFRNCKSETIEVHAPKWEDLREAIADCVNLRTIKAYLPVAYNCNELCSGSPLLEDFNCELPKASTLNNAFHKCILNKESVLRVINSIPAYTSGSHPLTIGIHIDHQTDDEVLAAIANAEAKGWTLTVQWNGTPTAQAATTYGLRKPLIYARVGEHELPDGTTERVLDWGHYVTDPTGYEEFRSVEAAREYYGLPEEDLTETE